MQRIQRIRSIRWIRCILALPGCLTMNPAPRRDDARHSERSVTLGATREARIAGTAQHYNGARRRATSPGGSF